MRHLRHTSVLATLVLLLLELLVVQSLLLLLVCHVTGVLCRWAWHGGRLRHTLNIVWRGNVVTIIGTVLAGRLGCIQTGLDEILALGFSDERLELGSGECVDETSLRDDEQEDLSTSKNR